MSVRGRNIGSGISGLIWIASALTLVACLTVFNPIARAVVGEAYGTYHLKNDPVVAYQAAHYQTMCRIYKNSTALERWTIAENWTNSWCKDYIDRM